MTYLTMELSNSITWNSVISIITGTIPVNSSASFRESHLVTTAKPHRRRSWLSVYLCNRGREPINNRSDAASRMMRSFNISAILRLRSLGWGERWWPPWSGRTHKWTFLLGIRNEEFFSVWVFLAGNTAILWVFNSWNISTLQGAQWLFCCPALPSAQSLRLQGMWWWQIHPSTGHFSCRSNAPPDGPPRLPEIAVAVAVPVNGS